VLSKIPYVFPVIGGRKLEDIQGNVKALDVVLTDEELDGIDNEEDFDIGFPFNLIYEFHGTQKYNSRMTSKDMPLVKSASYLEEPEAPKVRPHMKGFCSSC
jgi:hypothetical protein